MLSKAKLGALVSLVVSTNAHTIFQAVTVNGAYQGWGVGVRYPSYDGPVTDVTSTSLICNGNPNPLETPYSQTIINVPAGGTVGAQWDHVLQPNGWTSSDSQDPIDPSHLGPVMAYLAKVPSALQTDVTGLQWFKIWEDGFDGTTWGVQRLIAAKGLQSFTIPSCIAPGNYFLRVEIIALHAASSYPGAQFYMECAQINVTGGGSTSPATVSFPGAYHGTDPGITIDIYYPPVTSYTIPGPPVFSCSGGSSPPPPTTPAPKPTTTSTKAPGSSTPSPPPVTPTTTAPAGNGTSVPKYGQCGGEGYTGSTTCASGSTCTVSNPYYSQCL